MTLENTAVVKGNASLLKIELQEKDQEESFSPFLPHFLHFSYIFMKSGNNYTTVYAWTEKEGNWSGLLNSPSNRNVTTIQNNCSKGRLE